MTIYQTAQDIDTIARAILAHALTCGDWWEDWPDLGERDYEAVVRRAEQIANRPTVDEAEKAYRRLAERANHV